MSYIRPAKKSEVVAWLLTHGYAEEQPGYGHVSADELAEALISEWDLIGNFSSPS